MRNNSIGCFYYFTEGAIEPLEYFFMLIKSTPPAVLKNAANWLSFSRDMIAFRPIGAFEIFVNLKNAN
jgi:hypothetical protein